MNRDDRHRREDEHQHLRLGDDDRPCAADDFARNAEDVLDLGAAEEVAGAMQELSESLGPLRPGPDGEAELRAWIERFADLYEQSGAIIRTWTEAEIGGSEFGRLGTAMLTQFTRALVARISEVAPDDLDAANFDLFSLDEVPDQLARGDDAIHGPSIR